MGASAALHLALLLALLSVAWPAPQAPPVHAIPLDLGAWPRTLQTQAPRQPLKSAAPRRAPTAARPPAPPAAIAVAAPAAMAVAAPPEGSAAGASDIGAGELAGATVAGASGSGGACDMPRRLQDALQRDPLVVVAVGGFAGRAVRVWDGDWVWIEGEEGKGLPAVRQAIMWEVAFAPAECRRAAVRGLVVLDVQTPGGGVARLALGAPSWRWTDLLTPRDGEP